MKKILLVLFFISFLKAEAQETDFEVSLSAGPIISNIWKADELGAGFKSGLGYKVNENFTILAGFEYFSLPIQPDNIRPYYPINSTNDNKIDYINVEEKRATVIAGNLGFKINVFSSENFKPYLTAGLGLFSTSRTTLDYDRNLNDLFVVDEIPPYYAFYGAGIDCMIGKDKSVFFEITQSGFVDEKSKAFYTIPIRAGLKMWF